MLRILFYIVVLVLALSFFGVSIQSIVQSPTGQENFGFITGLFTTGWQWIVGTVTTVWHWIIAVMPF